MKKSFILLEGQTQTEVVGEIVKRHGGQMWVESKKGAGATFYMTLPLSLVFLLFCM